MEESPVKNVRSTREAQLGKTGKMNRVRRRRGKRPGSWSRSAGAVDGASPGLHAVRTALSFLSPFPPEGRGLGEGRAVPGSLGGAVRQAVNNPWQTLCL